MSDWTEVRDGVKAAIAPLEELMIRQHSELVAILERIAKTLGDIHSEIFDQNHKPL